MPDVVRSARRTLVNRRSPMPRRGPVRVMRPCIMSRMDTRRVIGSVARRLPRGRIRAAIWLNRHPGDGAIEFADITGHRRRADLRDSMECQWFAGVHLGLPSGVVGGSPR
jgi:hypothetical protein